MMKKWIMILTSCITLVVIMVIGVYIQIIPELKKYGDIEIERFNQLIISHCYFTTDSQYKNLVVIERGENNEIELLDFDMVKVNQLATSIVMDIEKTYASLEEGTFQASDESYYQRRMESVSKNGILAKIPLFSLLQIPVPSFLSPKISVHYKHLSSVGSSIEKNIQNYGVNHVMVELVIIIHIKLVMMYPFFAQYHSQDVRIPVLLEIFQGQVPLVYTQ